jgi:imidazolonepropionase-like amidohydrolase
MGLWKGCSGGDEYRPNSCRPFFEMLARRHIWQTPTLVAISELMVIGTAASSLDRERLAYATRSVRNMWAGNQRLFATPDLIRSFKINARVGAVVTKDMANVGIGVLAGCDTMIAGFCVHDELAAMVRGGMSPLAALQTATLNPARYFGLEHTSGRIGPGQRADLVLLDANPLIDIRNVARIRAVVVAGRLLDRHDLDTLLTQARIAASR